MVPVLDVLNMLGVFAMVDFRLSVAKVEVVNHLGLEIHELSQTQLVGVRDARSESKSDA